ncbi:serine/threonine-protein kinase PknH/PknJ [Mycobacterium sp. IS-1264]|uniref:serine/threonine-protein kinase PknH/PknJ n=1 Tax=Mycobacterium sp. IS-1264 TaxID=1834158 RepID=UPI00096F80C5|nr:serine/threonine-protein kinase PknH/PknJ [Mycobacterium sp. IS-1264]OMC47869.1 serine/threonine protein kinase [Mycobacterium sp. IS-1264]
MSDAVPASRVGTQFGPYRLMRLLGRGGMGEVYEAHDTAKDRTVALKLMSQEFNSDNVFRRRMQREAHTAGRLQEPHIVPIHDYGEIDGQLFIDMRFIEGTDLGGVLRREGALSPPRAVAIVSQVAAALDAAHRAGVVHRDIKPENILITGDDFAYLVDFGIAAAATDQHHLTQTGTAVGSWSYMAPERFGDDDVTYRSDIYALACVLFECLTGTRPYRTQNLTTLMGAHLMQPIPRPSQQRQGIPAAFDDVIARGMAKHPMHRYSSAGDLARAAQQALSVPDRERAVTMLAHTQQFAPAPSGPIPWAPPPLPHPAPVRRRPWLILAAVLTVVAAVAATGIWLGLANTDGGQAGSPVTTTSSPVTATTVTASTSAVPTVAAAQLDSILLSPDQINGVVGTTGIVVSRTTRDMKDPGPEDTLSDEQCRGPLIGYQTRVYKSSGYTAMVAQLMEKPNSNPGYAVVQGAVIFASTDQANGFVTGQVDQWRNCAGKSVTQVNNGHTSEWTFRQLSGNPPNIALQHSLAGSPVVCQHVLDAVSNVVLDINVCAPGTINQARLIANEMAAKIPK